MTNQNMKTHRQYTNINASSQTCKTCISKFKKFLGSIYDKNSQLINSALQSDNQADTQNIRLDENLTVIP